MKEFSFNQLRQANVKRCEESFHPLNDWSPTDWGCATAGEVGEACNIAKKMLRIAPNPEDEAAECAHYEILRYALAKELADMVIYADLFAARIGVDLGDIVMVKFNEVSDRVKSPIYLLR